MANHQVPRAAVQVEQLDATDADGQVFRCRVYRHTRAGHTRPDFYQVMYRLRPDGRIDRPTRLTAQFTGASAQARLDTEMTETRRLFAEVNAGQADAQDPLAGVEVVGTAGQLAHFDTAVRLSNEWAQAGSPPHPYQDGPGGWCGECGCAEPGPQHHQAGGAG